jgi:hypothetical protein
MTDSPFFEINEKLKEDLVNFFGSSKAKTVYRKAGNFLNPEPYLETEVFWTLKEFKGMDKGGDIMDEMSDLLFETKQEISKLGGQMTEPNFELHTGCPVLVWAIFASKPQGFHLNTP